MTTTKPKSTPPLSERNRVFSSGTTAAAALGIPPEVIKLARIRGADCFHASNRVYEKALLEFIIEEVIDYCCPVPAKISESEGFNYTVAEVIAAGPIYENDYSNGDFQVMRLIWGDESATKARDKRMKALRNVARVIVPALFSFREATEGKTVSPYAHAELAYLEEWNMSLAPLASLGADKLAFWTVGERFIDRSRKEIFDGCDWVLINHDNDIPPCLVAAEGYCPGLSRPTRKAKTIDWIELLGE